MEPFESLDTVSYSHFASTMTVCLAICEIFSVEEWHDLKSWVRGCSKSLKIYCAVRWIAYKYLLSFDSNYGPILYHFRDKA